MKYRDGSPKKEESQMVLFQVASVRTSSSLAWRHVVCFTSSLFAP